MVVEFVWKYPDIDESLRTCLRDPGKPLLIDDVAEAEFIANLKASSDDCREKLAATWESIDIGRANSRRNFGTPQGQ